MGAQQSGAPSCSSIVFFGAQAFLESGTRKIAAPYIEDFVAAHQGR
jgi:hypothetical protein